MTVIMKNVVTGILKLFILTFHEESVKGNWLQLIWY